MKWSVVLTIVVGGAAALALYPRINDEIRNHIERKIAKHYPGLTVHLRSAERVEGKGIRVRDLSITEPGAEGPNAEVLSIEEALLECSTEWKELIQGEPAIERVTVRRPTLRVTHRPDGSWSASKLLPPPQFGDHPPVVQVEGGVVEIFDPLKSPAGTMTLREVNLSLIPSIASPLPLGEGAGNKISPLPQGEKADNKISPLPLGEGPGVRANGTRTTSPSSNNAPLAKPQRIRQLKGMFAGDGFRRVEIEGWADLDTGVCSIQGQAEAIDVSPELRDSLPSPLTSKLPSIDLHGQGDLRFTVRYDPTAILPLKYDVTGRLTRGRIDDARLPQPLTEIRTAIHVDNGGYTIDDLSARSGQAKLRMACRSSGFDANSPLRLTAEIRQLNLDRALLNILPSSLQNQWYKYCPAGDIDADVDLSFDGKTWKRDVSVQCLNVSFTHHKFPYRLEYGKGTLELKDERIRLKMKAYSGSQPIDLSCETENAFTAPTGWFEARGDELELNESLLAAMPEKASKVVRSLNPRGTIDFYIRMWRERPDEPMHQHLSVAANRCAIRYDKFPYPINDIRGTIDMIDGVWEFRNLEGSNDSARITCEGRLTPGLQGNELVLKLDGANVALREDLRNALSPHIQQVWRDLQPRGMVDLSAEIRYLSEQSQFSVGVQLRPQPQNASIEPVHFPYRLDQLQGVLNYRDGHVSFEQCKARHGAVSVSTDGYCDFMPDGRWTVCFSKLLADRLQADRETMQALPERLRKIVTDLNPTGTLNLQGRLELERTGAPDEPLHSRWDVRLGLQQSDLHFGGIYVQNVHGVAALKGGFNGQKLESRGELMVDSLTYRDIQLTQVVGPVWIDDAQVLFGSCVDDPRVNVAATPAIAGQAQRPRPLTAYYCGGKFFADGWVTFEAEPRYRVNVTLTDADLARCAQEMGAGQPNLRGKIIATADLSGTGRTRNSLSGCGKIQLTESDVYSLPVMVALMKILGLPPPQQNAFSAASIDYRIEGEHIYFDRLDFHGDAISLRGKGEMNFQSQIRLTFYAMVGRGELDLPVIKQVFSGASQQIMLIHVDGTLQNPQTSKEALPMVNQVLQELKGDAPSRR